MFNKQIKKFGDLYFEASKSLFKKYGFANQGIVSQWRKIVGDQLADISIPERINFPLNKTTEGTIIIKVSNPAFSLVIQAQENRIIDKISTFFGYRAVSRIKIRIAPTKTYEILDEVISYVKRNEIKEYRLDAAIIAKIEKIKDDKLKDAMMGLAKSLKL
jgi:hypothetical protein